MLRAIIKVATPNEIPKIEIVEIRLRNREFRLDLINLVKMKNDKFKSF